MCLEQMDATSEESRPPESSTPKGTSLIIRFTTAFSNFPRSTPRSISAGGGTTGGTFSKSVSHCGLYHRENSIVLLLKMWPGLNTSKRSHSSFSAFISDANHTLPARPYPMYIVVMPIGSRAAMKLPSRLSYTTKANMPSSCDTKPSPRSSYMCAITSQSDSEPNLRARRAWISRFSARWL